MWNMGTWLMTHVLRSPSDKTCSQFARTRHCFSPSVRSKNPGLSLSRPIWAVPSLPSDRSWSVKIQGVIGGHTTWFCRGWPVLHGTQSQSTSIAHLGFSESTGQSSFFSAHCNFGGIPVYPMKSEFHLPTQFLHGDFCFPMRGCSSAELEGSLSKTARWQARDWVSTCWSSGRPPQNHTQTNSWGQTLSAWTVWS